MRLHVWTSGFLVMIALVTASGFRAAYASDCDRAAAIRTHVCSSDAELLRPIGPARHGVELS
jgi:fructose-1,6-bisphosphatase/sedoheptulose 1,7-bisphosphatase-like protein